MSARQGDISARRATYTDHPEAVHDGLQAVSRASYFTNCSAGLPLGSGRAGHGRLAPDVCANGAFRYSVGIFVVVLMPSPDEGRSTDDPECGWCEGGVVGLRGELPGEAVVAEVDVVGDPDLHREQDAAVRGDRADWLAVEQVGLRRVGQDLLDVVRAARRCEAERSRTGVGELDAVVEQLTALYAERAESRLELDGARADDRDL